MRGLAKEDSCHAQSKMCIHFIEMQILAIHGQMGMASDWDVYSEAMTKLGHQLVAVDLWSYLEREEVSLIEMGRKLNEDYDQGMVLMGYSMGGRLALQALLDKPNNWKAAVIISSHTGLDWAEREARQKLDSEWASKVAGSAWLEFLNAWNNQEVLVNQVMPDRVTLETRRTEIARSFHCWSTAMQENLLDQLGTVEIPVLWIVGEKDEKFCKVGEIALEMLKSAKLEKIKNSGHRVLWEAENEVRSVITKFLRTVL
jgi:2-succinyl-6-hydroxy-2,4-cyclohexadiene-1-carboxylate synthase